MELREGYKQTEVGVIPEDWDVTLVGDEFSIQLGKMLDAEKNVGIEKSYLGNSAVQWGRFDLTDLGSIRLTRGDIQRFRLKKGDLLVCEGGEVGRAAIWNNETDECYYQKALHRLRPKGGFNSQLLLNILCRYASTGFLTKFITQTSIAHLPKEKLEDVPLPLPPTLAEQTAIANALSDADALIQSLTRLIAKKRQIKQGAMQTLLNPYVDGRLKAGWAVNNILALADNKKELFDDGDWIEAEHITSKGVRLIQTGNIGVGCYVEKVVKKYIYEESFEKLHCKPPRKGDLLICRLAEPAGRACVLPNIGEDKVVTSVDVTIFRPREDVACRIYLANLFSTPDWFKKVNESVGGTTHKRISRGSLGKIEVALPPICEQKSTAAILSDMDADIAALESKLSKAQQIKQGMMQNLLTGKIRLVNN